jgi:hypothetical protein
MTNAQYTGKVVKVLARVRDEAEIRGGSMTRADRREVFRGVRFEFVEPLQPALEMTFLQVE